MNRSKEKHVSMKTDLYFFEGKSDSLFVGIGLLLLILFLCSGFF